MLELKAWSGLEHDVVVTAERSLSMSDSFCMSGKNLPVSVGNVPHQQIVPNCASFIICMECGVFFYIRLKIFQKTLLQILRSMKGYE